MCSDTVRFNFFRTNNERRNELQKCSIWWLNNRDEFLWCSFTSFRNLIGMKVSMLWKQALDNFMRASESSNVLLSRTQLNMTESHEKIWALFINQNLSRLSYGLRWFEVVPRTNLVGEFGISMTTVTEKAELFLGVHFNFANSAKVDVTSGSHLLTNSAQTLSAQRRIALPYLWRNHFRILDKWWSLWSPGGCNTII